ncbi:Uu.00g109250.m01.CDS01 [Anthostomella pinea]|uniref:Uu.00g109250.m01.CDS01 n=1 Tax=Anthostomella pinea TaxID=933095 RepID=A0AAI8VEK5_9PEZI|nr:Uu.00g109250.m01.CDS01 [Anthostomella pinea]
MSPPLITHDYTADPSAHVFEGKVYIYPSHDRETDIEFNDNGDQYDMADYHVFSTSSLDPPYDSVTDHGVILRTEDVPWASKQLWAPDAAHKNGRYYLFFPARDKSNIFRIGVAEGPTPTGPFVADPEPIPGSFSIDPAAFVEPDTGDAYLYFGGLWGGQLQCWKGNSSSASTEKGGEAKLDEHGLPPFDATLQGPQEPSGPNVHALFPKVAHLAPSMHSFLSPAQDLVILAPETGAPILADDHDRRFFEAAWMHKRNSTYYFSYSTGDTHYLVYATSKSPLGPFTYAGRILEPVLGWTTHHSIAEFGGRWWLFHHDCELSGGVNHLRCVKVREILYDDEGRILPVEGE